MKKAFDNVGSHQTETALKDLREFCIGTIKSDGDGKPIITEKEYKYNVDLKKGILWQVWTKMKLDEYLEFIHDPKHMINPPEAILFENKFLEIFTKTPWWVIPLLWVPGILYYLNYSYFELNYTVAEVMFYYIVGLFAWTLTEYILHRFLFHYDEKLPDNNWALMLHFLFHGIHHAFPMDK
jgi:4-hydroxysphinganine ceramide fatty acyl 2-hydroxylase